LVAPRGLARIRGAYPDLTVDSSRVVEQEGVMKRRRIPPWALAVLAAAIGLAMPLAVSGRSIRPAEAGVRGAGTHADGLLVRFRAGAPAGQVQSVLAAAGAVQIGRLDALGTIVVAPSVGQARGRVKSSLSTSGIVESVESDGLAHVTLTPNDPLWSDEWWARKVRAPRAWDVTTGADGPVIAVLDTGVAAGHRDLQGRVIAGRDFVNDDNNPADDNGHGTMVAGVAGGRGNNSVGIAGACWGCRILAVKVANRRGDVAWSNAAAGLIWATDHGAHVVNMSFGHSFGSATMASAVAYANNHGVVLVASAGNKGTRAKFYPASYPGVLSVAATTSNDNLFSWSTRGDWVRVAAPGCAVTTKKNGGWGSFCGTSAAAPIVAGIAGLALALKPGASRSQVINAITQSAVFVTSAIGGGRVDAYSALRAIGGG
jgi:subtilisin family serine protease